MGLIPIKTPVLVKTMFPNYTWDMTTDEKIIHLSFDDGPTPNITNWTLDVLKEFHAKATFFCIGNNIEKYPEIFQNIVNDGHAVGNHTHNHIKGWKTNTTDYLKNVSDAQIIIDHHNQKINNRNLFRPPYGQITPIQGKKLIAMGYKIIMWDVLSFDWDKNVTPETCLNHVISKATKGSVVVFHDSIKASKNMQYALPKVLDYYSKKGYVFKELSL
ncbi:polysaccharide deacetylase family protein [Changchengzhania lutea]|uniref:polysaccharide deacetylase family protein n=1 Tax=Changchengzhania lutea TaxID=2049305 RepID=UPI00115F3F72|nr:polysaccharide deacetylase family protein [Changchengzhania lutea]